MSNKIKISKCKYCGKDIILNAAQRYRLKRNGYIYCNHKCSHRGHSNSYRKDISNEIIKKLYTEKELTPKQIANRLNCSARTIYFRLRKISIPIRRILHSDKYLVKICPICGKKFHTYLSQETKTCGYRCGAILRCDIKGRKKKIKRKCKYCGKEIEVPLRFATKTIGWYCSYKCRGNAQIRSVKRKCLNCGKIFYKPVCRLKESALKYCSFYCYRHHTNESTLEKEVREELEKLRINYLREVPFGKYFADFLLPEYKGIIEVDGSYWHQKRKVKERDIRKDKLLKKLGYSVFRISEEKLRNNVSQAVNEAIEILI